MHLLADRLAGCGVGQGAGPEGSRPFLDLLDIDTMETKRIWQSSPPFYEAPGSLMCDYNNVRLAPNT